MLQKHILKTIQQYSNIIHSRGKYHSLRYFSTKITNSTQLPSLHEFPDEIYPDRAEIAMKDKKPILDFTDTKEAFKSKSLQKLFMTALIFRICSMRIIVNNAEFLMNLARKIFGDRIVLPIVKYTFYAHFCAGEDVMTIKPTIDFLSSYHIGPILDYAAESDVVEPEDQSKKSENTTGPHSHIPKDLVDASVDSAVRIFQHCIRTVGQVAHKGDGFAAIKLTALTDPNYLQRFSLMIENFIAVFADHKPLSKPEFIDFMKQRFMMEENEIETLFTKLDLEKDGIISQFDWTYALTCEEILQLFSKLKTDYYLPHVASTLRYEKKDSEILAVLVKNVNKVIDEAVPLKVKVMVDAEHQYFQSCVDHIIYDLQRVYNKDKAIVYGTYQCYLKQSPRRVQNDLYAAKIFGYKWGAKLVRGAYMEHERFQAAKQGLPSPIHNTIEDTHASYNFCLDYVLKNDPNADLMCASHNQKTIEYAIQMMKDLNLPNDSERVQFAQLLGMADHLTFSLGQAGYNAKKYVPFGKVDEALPYLFRRAQENSNMLGGVGLERKMIWREIKRRLGF